MMICKGRRSDETFSRKELDIWLSGRPESLILELPGRQQSPEVNMSNKWKLPLWFAQAIVRDVGEIVVDAYCLSGNGVKVWRTMTTLCSSVGDPKYKVPLKALVTVIPASAAPKPDVGTNFHRKVGRGRRLLKSQPQRDITDNRREIAEGSLQYPSSLHGAPVTGTTCLQSSLQTQLSWDRLMLEYTKRGQGREALRLYKKIRDAGVTPSTYTSVAALKACSILGDLKTGKEIHAQVSENGDKASIFVANALVNMYAVCGSMIDAYQVFERVPDPDVVSWTTIITGYAKRKECDFALQLFSRMQREGCAPNPRTFVAALKACSSLSEQEASDLVNGEFVKVRCLEKVRAIHSQIAHNDFESHVFVANTLVDVYVKCGSMVDARLVFERIAQRTVVSWNAMIMGYATTNAEEALHLYARMQQEGFAPNARTFVAALKSCLARNLGKLRDNESVASGYLVNIRAIHSDVAKSGLESELFVANTLVDVYGKLGCTREARQVFECMSSRDVISWNAMIMGYAQRDGDEALKLFARMQHEAYQPNSRTFVAALKACSCLAAQEAGKIVDGDLVKVVCLEKGRAIHSELTKRGIVSDKFVGNALVDMYCKCGSLVDALKVFERMPNLDVVSWTTMILGYVQKEQGESALDLFLQMQRKGIAPDACTFVAALKACCILAAQEKTELFDGELIKFRSLDRGRAVHAEAVKNGFESDIVFASTLVNMYAKCGSMADACLVFDNMQCRNEVSWTALIMGYVQREEGQAALQLYSRMQDERFSPDAHTFCAALKACSILAAQEHVTQVDGELVRICSLERGRAIHLQLARCGFDSDVFVISCLVDMYARCGSMRKARRVFERIQHRDVLPWTAMIMGYVHQGEGALALQMYARMQHEGITLNVNTFVAALEACGNLAALETGKKIHKEICRVGLQKDATVVTSLIDMYGKSGSMVDAQLLFDAFSGTDVVTWAALIGGYSRLGDFQNVFSLFQKMLQEDIEPDGILFLSLLTVCSHAGLVENGQKLFQMMCSKYGIIPSVEHYNCLIDLLGRAGELDEAVAVVKDMPLQPAIGTWMTIMSASRKWNNVQVGRNAFDCAVSLDEKEPAAYVLMAQIYAAAQMWEEQAEIQAMQRKAIAYKKPPGKSWWTDSAGVVHTFLAGATSHPQSTLIYAKLRTLIMRMKEEGYIPDLNSVSHNMSDDAKEDVLCGHSERLAIACALINSPQGSPVRIAKNLRVCNDCHNAIAVISKIEKRDIICRDANRFHVYKDGKCSCGDFW